MAKGISLDSGSIKLSFDHHEDRLSLSGISGTDNLNWLSKPQGSLWKIEFRGPEATSVVTESQQSSLSDIRQRGDETRFVWKADLGESEALVVVIVRCAKGSPLSYWSLSADLPKGWRVWQADFPIIPNIKLNKGLKMAAPAGWGVEYDMKPGVGYSGIYPSCTTCMQFVAFYNRGRGLYLAAHDVRANHKVFNANAGDREVIFRLTNHPAIPEESGKTFRLPYEIVVGLFTGDYYEAAQIYREFTFTAPWGKAGQVSKRPIPRWVKDTDLWLRPDGSPEDNVEITKKALKYFDVPTSLHWYRWHVIPYDTLYPEYFPPLPGFAEGIKALQEAGTHVMPYINGRLCDPNSATWNEEQGSKSAARQENGEPYTEVYGSKVPLNVMCPYTEQWQTKIEGLVDRLIQECGVDGVYIDQIAAAYAVRCFDPEHGHPIGGGHFWVDGYRRMLDMVRKRLPKDRMITSEENAECWIDQFDALLLVNSPTSHKLIPLFPAVYSGRTINFGFLYFPADDLPKSLPFRVKMAQAFLWGSQLGWIQPSKIMEPQYANEAEFLKNLAKCRSTAHDFLTYGKFLGLLNVKGDIPNLTCTASGSFGGTYEIDVPAVLASEWQSEDGRKAVTLVNMSDEAQKVEVRGEKAAIPARDALVLSIDD